MEVLKIVHCNFSATEFAAEKQIAKMGTLEKNLGEKVKITLYSVFEKEIYCCSFPYLTILFTEFLYT